ncbi:FadR family transcriptional regulator (plasmid) [Streptomyces sp. NBC_00841]|uniref:FadR/GntR family transcriptional regulator n=1 Tax=unclassified Streptomyces TaxID=2593676 RepID=UPI002257C817|nr:MULTISPECIES: FadR/GntR family transcriptional regulator [unclassified Streptomyces]MCX4538831.1 FadR family transcriptional regulator [Streptomyces sp. NBC_01669]WSA05374.1 FadR family transcriptional regulator [Streptomyces sp. NBC_00841]
MSRPPRGLHQHLVDDLGQRIVAGTYAPGESLHPDALEQELEVSKTALREALRVLAAKGLIESRQKRGTFVRPRADWNLLDTDLLRWQRDRAADNDFLANVGEVRLIVEPPAARLAAQRREASDLDALEGALTAMAEAGTDSDASVEADVAFHCALLAAAHNELLTRMAMVIEAGLRVRDPLIHGGGEWADPLPQHQAVLDAVRARDSDAAERAVQYLLVEAAADLDDLLQSPHRSGASCRSPR